MSVTQELKGIDLWDRALFVDGPPIELLMRLQAEAPAYWSPHASDRDGGFWSLTRYADVQAMSKDHERFTTGQGIGWPRRDPATIYLLAENIMYRDPPNHTAHRKPLNRMFTVKAMNAIEGMVREIVVGVLDRVEGESRFDWVAEVAAEIPARVVAAVIGVPEEDHRDIVRWATIGFARDGSPETEAAARESALAQAAYASDLISSRRAKPADDMLTMLLSVEVEGRPLTDSLLHMWFGTLVGAGFETTFTAMAQGMVLLDRLPEVRAQLMADRSLIDPAVEEMLRYITPVNFMARTATVDMELHGQTIRKGQYVCMWYAAANRDPEVFDDPHRFIVDRDPNPHQSFGATVSPHYCIGAQLARVELRVLVDELANRGFPFRVDGRPERTGSVFVNALKRLPVARL